MFRTPSFRGPSCQFSRARLGAMKLTRQGTAIAGFGFGLALVAFMTFISYRSMQSFRGSSEKARESYEQLLELERIDMQVRELRRAVRGYVITGDEEFLRPYELALREIQSGVEVLRQAAAGAPFLKPHQEALELLISKAVSLHQEIVAVRRTLGFEPAAQMIRDRIGQEVIDEIGQHLKELENRRELALEEWITQAEASAKSATLTILLSFLASSAFFLFGFSRLHRELIERRRVEQALIRSRDYTWSLFEDFPSLVWRTGPDGKCDYFNRTWYRFTGRTPEEEMGDGWTKGVHPGDLGRILTTQKEAFRERRSLVLEYRLRNCEGRYRWMTSIGRPFDDGYGQFAGYLGTSHDVTERKEFEESLIALSGRLLELQDEERRRIARELHDGTGQNLTGVLMNLSVLSQSVARLEPQGREALAESFSLIRKTLNEIRTLSYLLHPPLLDELGLSSALRDYVDGVSKRSGLHVQLEISDGQAVRPSLDKETALFRVAQECLGNIVKHSGSRTAEIRLSQNDEAITLEVRDQGRGFAQEAIRSVEKATPRLGVGISGMRERLRQLGGVLQIISGSQGTTIVARLPLGANEGQGEAIAVSA